MKIDFGFAKRENKVKNRVVAASKTVFDRVTQYNPKYYGYFTNLIFKIYFLFVLSRDSLDNTQFEMKHSAIVH